MEDLILYLFIGIMVLIAWFPVVVWGVLFVLFLVLLFKCVVLRKTKKETVFFILLPLFVFSFPAFKIVSSRIEEKTLDSMRGQTVREEGRVIQGLELPIGTKLFYRVGKHDFKDEDVGQMYFNPDFLWGDLKIDYISYPKSYTSTHYFYKNDSDIIGNIISVDIKNNSIIDGWWCEKGLIDFRRKVGKPKFDLSRKNYDLASCKLDSKKALKFGEVEYPPSFYFGSILHKEEDDSFESLMGEVSEKTDGKIAGESLMRSTHPRGFFLETEWSKLHADRVKSIIDPDKNILFFDVELMPIDEDFVRLGGCLYKASQKATLTPSNKKHLLNIVFEGDDIENQCKKHVLPYKFIEK